MPSRLSDLKDFYLLLDRLAQKAGRHRLSSSELNRRILPARGVYFFMEDGETRTDTGLGPRVVRIGTHALKEGAQSTLWKRLSQHKGVATSGGGNHRGSIFRLLIGTTIVDTITCPSWGKGIAASADVRQAESRHEVAVSAVICDMPFLFLEIDDAPGPASLRGVIERNAISLLSNWRREPLDAPSSTWRGYRCDREKVKQSGLWNQNHVQDSHASEFLNTFETLINKMRSLP